MNVDLPYNQWHQVARLLVEYTSLRGSLERCLLLRLTLLPAISIPSVFKGNVGILKSSSRLTRRDFQSSFRDVSSENRDRVEEAAESSSSLFLSPLLLLLALLLLPFLRLMLSLAYAIIFFWLSISVSIVMYLTVTLKTLFRLTVQLGESRKVTFSITMLSPWSMLRSLGRPWPYSNESIKRGRRRRRRRRV